MAHGRAGTEDQARFPASARPQLWLELAAPVALTNRRLRRRWTARAYSFRVATIQDQSDDQDSPIPQLPFDAL